MNMCRCPRCGERSYEQLKTYSHCVNCFYVEDSWSDTETQFHDALKAVREIPTIKQQAQVISLENVVKLPKGKKSASQEEAHIIPLQKGVNL